MKFKKLLDDEYNLRLNDYATQLEQQNLESNKQRQVIGRLANELNTYKLNAEFSVEKTLKGFHVSVHKRGNDAKIFSENKKDMSDSFPTLIDEIKNLSDSDFIIDGGLVSCEKEKELNDSNVSLYCWDCIYFDKPIINQLLSERLDFLSKLKFSNRIINNERKIVSEKDLKSAIQWASNIGDSNGAVIKRLDESYETGEKGWVKYKRPDKLKID